MLDQAEVDGLVCCARLFQGKYRSPADLVNAVLKSFRSLGDEESLEIARAIEDNRKEAERIVFDALSY